eukprot:scaffold3779_cov254-Ochromonas_danica.AAC.31
MERPIVFQTTASFQAVLSLSRVYPHKTKLRRNVDQDEEQSGVSDELKPEAIANNSKDKPSGWLHLSH